MKSSTFGMDFKKICDAFSKRFGGKWILLFRNHNFVKAKNKFAGAIDVSGYHDMQELMYAADVLISDYSSCLYDFCFTGKPAFVYATDIDNYVANERAFAYPIEKWPFPIADSNSALEEKILAFDENDYNARVKAHLEDGGAYDNGTASAQAVAIIKKYCFKRKKPAVAE
jgi:CDP-glycerol glycerophosphotransferase